MKKKAVLRLLSVIVSTVIVISAFSVALPVIFASAQSDKTEVTPLLPFKTYSIGGTVVEKVEGNGVFNNSDVASVSSDTEIKGILAEYEDVEADPSLGVVVTPLTSGVKVSYNYATVKSEFINTTPLTEEKGVRIEPVNGRYEVNDIVSSQAYAAVQYAEKNSFLGVDGIMFYLKLDAANTVVPNFSTFMPENPNRWNHSWNPVIVLGVGLEYSYMPINGDSWTKAKAIVGKEGNNTYFGAIKFDSAFEGYIKIPSSSLINDSKFTFKNNEDSYYQLTVQAKGLGGEYGNLTAGPFFAVNTDSTMGKITISDKKAEEAPHDVGVNITGFDLPMKDADSLLVYVKTDAANRVGIKASVTDEYLDRVPRYLTNANAPVYLLEKGSNGWNQTKTVRTDREGAVVFDKAFEGYIKIPISSLIEEESSPPIAILPEFSNITGVEVGFAGIGGKYGSAKAVPFIIYNDSESAELVLPEGYTPPEVQKQIVTPVDGGRLLKYNGQWVQHTELKPLDFTDETGSSMKATATDGFKYDNINQSQLYANYEFNARSLSGYNGLVLYVKLDAGNTVCPQIEFYKPSDTARWRFSYNPIMVWKVGANYEYLPKGETVWKSATTVAGVEGNQYHGSAKFDEAFEGYIRVPFSSLYNDSGFMMSTELDSIYRIAYKLQGLGGDYKGATLGPSFFMMTESGEDIELYKPEPEVQKVTPIKNHILRKYNTATVNHNEIAPLDFTDVKGTKLTAAQAGQYEGENVNKSQVYANFEYGSLDFKDYDGIIVYLKLEAGNIFCPQVELAKPTDTTRWKYSWNPIMVWLAGKPFEYLPIGETEWKTGTTVQGVSGSQYNGSAKFDEAFEGYIKIPFSSLYNDSGFSIKPELDKIERVVYKALGIGGKYKGLTVGPSFFMMNDGALGFEYIEDPSATVPEGPSGPVGEEPEDPYEKIQWIFENSKAGNMQGYYFMVGDSTRHELGYPVFRLVRHQMMEKYNMICTVQALSGLKTEHWSGATPGLQGTNPTVEQLIDMIPGTGQGSIVDIALAINDSWKSGTVIADYLLMGINKIRAAKPDAVIVYTSPNPIADNISNKHMREAASIIWQDKSIYAIDTLDGVFADYYAKYYRDTHHPNVEGYRLLAQFILSKYFGGPEFERIEENAQIDDNPVELPDNASIITEDFKYVGYNTVLNAVNLTVSQNGNETVNKGISISANEEFIAPSGTAATTPKVVKFTDVSFKGDGIAMYIRVDKPQEIALSLEAIPVGKTEKRERMMMAYQYYQYLPEGETEWRIAKTGAGRPGNENYGALYFDKPFEGFIYLPMSSFYYGSTKEEIVELNFRMGYLGVTPSVVMMPMIKFENPVPVHDKKVTIPAGAELLKSELSVNKTLNLSTLRVKYDTAQGYAGALLVNATAEFTGKTPFNTSNFIETNLSEPMIGYDYITFHIDLPSANKIGLTAFTKDGTKENIFKNFARYYVMPDGASQWQTKNATAGRKDGSETYGAIQFDSAFSGWVKVPLSNFYGSPSSKENINKITMRFSEMGGNYGELKVGAFLGIKDEPYVAKNVWNKSALPEMTPFTPITKFTTHTELSHKEIPSPIPTLSNNASMLISSTVGVDKDSYLHYYWASNFYDNMPVGNFSHLMFYIKVPEAKENLLTICMFTDTHYEFKEMANTDYALLSLGSNEWEHYLHEKYKNSWGGIRLPAGFEGFLKIPVASLLPASRIKSDTVFSELCYRFSYIGSDEDAVLIGPAFGVTKDNDPGPKDMVYTSMPEPTTIKSLYAPENGDIFTDSIMLYWEKYDDASGYIMEAYSVTKVEKGFEYRLAASNTAFTNSGTITGLMPNRQYAVLVKAVDSMGNVIAVYDYTLIKTLNEETVKAPLISDKMNYDKVYYPVSEIMQNGDGGGINVLLIVGIASAVLFSAIVIAIIIIVAKRGKKNA